MFYIIVLYYIILYDLIYIVHIRVISWTLTQYVPVLPWYKNQSFDLHSKWCLYEGNTGT